MNVLLSVIRLPENMSRKSVSEVGLEGLAKSMEEVGLINPIVVRKTKDGYEIVAGFRRYMAASMLKWEKISARVVKVGDNVAEKIKVDENKEREDLNAIEEGTYFESLIKRMEINQKELAGMLKLSEAYISQRIQCVEWPETLKNLVETGQMVFSVARELAKVKNMDDMIRLIDQALKGGVTPAVAGRWRHEANREDLARGEGAVLGVGGPGPGGTAGALGNCHVCGGEYKEGEYQILAVCGDCLAVITAGREKGVFKKEVEA